MTYLEKQLRQVINQNETNLGHFINEKINDRFFYRRNRKQLIKLLPIIMEYTNNDNFVWMDSKNIQFIETKGFIDTFIDNLEQFHFEDNIFLFDQLFSMFSLVKLSNNQIKKLIDKLPECDCKFNFYAIESICNLIKNNDVELEQYMLCKYIKNESTCDTCVHFCSRDNQYLNLIYENMDFIMENIKSIDLFHLKKMLESNEEAVTKIKNKIDKNKKESVINLIKKIYESFASKINTLKESKKIETILEVIYLIIEDICKNEQVSVSDISIIDTGSYSTALEVGNKVIKIGKPRITKSFYNNPYVNAILLRKEFTISENTSIFVEVNEKVDRKSHISNEELYQLYKKIRDIHLIWSDVATRNVGRLLKDNKVHWREELPLSDEILGLYPYRGEEINLKKGEIVILDNDVIFDENDSPGTINRYNTYYREEFEKRYQQEVMLDRNSENVAKKI